MSDSAPHSVRSVVSTDGTALAYRSLGDPTRRTLVLVHGWAQSGEAWGYDLLVDLASDLHVVAVDLRGCGHSDVAEQGYDRSAQWADDLRTVLLDSGAVDDEGPGCVLLGWSYGGIVCADYLAAYGTTGVDGLVLCGAVTAIGRSAGGRVGPAMMAVADGAFDDDPKRAIAALAGFGTAMMRGQDGAGQQRMFGLSLSTPPEVRRKMLERRVEHDDTLRGLTVPALVLHGADDGVVLPEAGRANAEMIPDSRFVEFDECAHAPFLERRAEFLDEVRRFCAGL